MTVGEKIRTLRKNEKLSQEELAEALKVDRTNVSMWETGKAKPQASSISALARFFKVSASYFLDENEKITHPSKPGDSRNPDRALLTAILDEVTIMKSKNEGISYADAKAQIKKKASLILESLDSWLTE